MRQRNADRIINRRRARECRVESLPVHLADELEADLTRDLPMEFAPGELAARLATDMDGERRRGIMEELLSMIVREHDPEIRLLCLETIANLASDLLHRRDGFLRLRVGLREKL